MALEEVLIANALATWKNNLNRADALFHGLTPEALLNRVAPERNRLVYLWGHLAAVHDRMLQLLEIGARIHPEFDAVFLTSPDGASELPSVDTMRSWWKEVSAGLDEGFTRFTTADWLSRHAAVSEEDFAKDPQRNRFAILLSRTNHLSYHLGQAVLAAQ